MDKLLESSYAVTVDHKDVTESVVYALGLATTYTTRFGPEPILNRIEARLYGEPVELQFAGLVMDRDEVMLVVYRHSRYEDGETFVHYIVVDRDTDNERFVARQEIFEQPPAVPVGTF